MKRFSAYSHWIALGVLLILGIWLYFDLKQPVREPGENPKISAIVGIKPDEVTRIEIASDGKNVVLTRSASRWTIEQPVQAEADADAVKRALDDILDQSTEYVMEKAPADLSRWGLAKPTRSIAMASSGKKVTLQLGTEDPGKSSYFVRLVQGGKVFLASKYALDGLLSKTVDDLRDKTLLSIAKDTIERIRVQGAKGAATLARTGGKWMLTEPISVPADEFAADGLADALASLKADKFVAADAHDLAQYGLDKPQLVVEVQAKGGAQYGVRVGKGVPGGTGLYAARTSDSSVMQLARATFETLNKGVGDLRSRKMLDVETDRVERIAVVSRKIRWEAVRAGDGWKFVEPNAGKKADAIDVDNVILDATASADRWITDNPTEADLANYGLVKPELTVTLTLKGGVTKKLEAGKKNATGDYYIRGSDTGSSIFAVGSYVIERLETVPKVAASPR
jgi:hypothetical protein